MRFGTTLAATSLALCAGILSAATPESGKIDDENPTTSWEGLLLTPNPGGSTVPRVCEEGTPLCDVYRFEVDITDINPDDDLIHVTLEWSPEQADVDLYVFNEDTGVQVASGTASAGGRDAAIFFAQNGNYRVEVMPWAAAAQSYTGTVAYERFEDDKSYLGFAGTMGAPMLVILAGLSAARRRYKLIR